LTPNPIEQMSAACGNRQLWRHAAELFERGERVRVRRGRRAHGRRKIVATVFSLDPNLT
jgi:hypothetical protein